MLSDARAKLVVASIVAVAILVVPAPLLPPHRFAQAVQSTLGVEWQSAYLVAAVALQVGFYGALGLLSALVVNRPERFWKRLLQIVVVSLLVIAATEIVRSVKLGHVPVLANSVIPIAAAMFGVLLGLGLLYRGWKTTLPVAVAVIVAALWGLIGDSPAQLTDATDGRLRQLLAAAPDLPSGDERFGELLRVAFAELSSDTASDNSVQENRAAILALGIAVGHERLARLVGSRLDPELVRRATALQLGTTLRAREDWARHFTLSAALAVLENPLLSDVGGLMKEQLDALTRGSGFSFADLAADRAGVRFAAAATYSKVTATAMQARLSSGFVVDDFFPTVADLPEGLTIEQFRQDYDSVGSRRYRQMVNEIEARLDRCAALTRVP